VTVDEVAIGDPYPLGSSGDRLIFGGQGEFFRFEAHGRIMAIF
jgi:hypothetical protein